jgi:hypothetical protein
MTSKLADNMKKQFNAIYALLESDEFEQGEIHTLFAQVVGLLVHDTRGPPLGLGLLGITSGARSGSRRGLASVVRVSNLLAGLDELDKGLGDHAAVELLEVLESTLIIASNLLGFSNTQGDHVVGCILGVVIIIRDLIDQAVIKDRGCGAVAAADTARRGVQSPF